MTDEHFIHPASPDDGCEVHPSCLSCPLPTCKWDLSPEDYRRLMNLLKFVKLERTMAEEGLTPAQAAPRFGLTVRSVFRRLQKLRKARQEGFLGPRDSPHWG